MKRILALTLCCVIFISSSLCAFASEGNATSEGSPSIGDIVRELEEIKRQNAEYAKQIAALTEAVKAKGSGGGGGRSSSPAPASTPSNSNYVNFGGTMTYQGGKIEINGGKSNATFTITAPSSGVISSAANYAGKVGGTLLSCIATSSPGVAFKTAKVNFYVAGVQNGDTIAVYQKQGNSWVQLPVTEVRQDHVVVNMTRHGELAFVRVAAVASITG